MNPMENYCSLMWTIRSRFDVIDTLRQSSADFFSRAEVETYPTLASRPPNRRRTGTRLRGLKE